MLVRVVYFRNCVMRYDFVELPARNRSTRSGVAFRIVELKVRWRCFVLSCVDSGLVSVFPNCYVFSFSFFTLKFSSSVQILFIFNNNNFVICVMEAIWICSVHIRDYLKAYSPDLRLLTLRLELPA